MRVLQFLPEHASEMPSAPVKSSRLTIISAVFPPLNLPAGLFGIPILQMPLPEICYGPCLWLE